MHSLGELNPPLPLDSEKVSFHRSIADGTFETAINRLVSERDTSGLTDVFRAYPQPCLESRALTEVFIEHFGLLYLSESGGPFAPRSESLEQLQVVLGRARSHGPHGLAEAYRVLALFHRAGLTRRRKISGYLGRLRTLPLKERSRFFGTLEQLRHPFRRSQLNAADRLRVSRRTRRFADEFAVELAGLRLGSQGDA